jgi:ATP-dependent Clp protease adaptor protein ClpS
MGSVKEPLKPGTETEQGDVATLLAPMYHVILHDDPNHTYEYVIEMLMDLFGKSPERAFEHAREVDKTGVTIVDTTSLERAELKRDQIKAWGPDYRIKESKSGMYATIEPAE